MVLGDDTRRNMAAKARFSNDPRVEFGKLHSKAVGPHPVANFEMVRLLRPHSIYYHGSSDAVSVELPCRAGMKAPCLLQAFTRGIYTEALTWMQFHRCATQAISKYSKVLRGCLENSSRHVLVFQASADQHHGPSLHSRGVCRCTLAIIQQCTCGPSLLAGCLPFQADSDVRRATMQSQGSHVQIHLARQAAPRQGGHAEGHRPALCTTSGGWGGCGRRPVGLQHKDQQLQ